MKTKLQLLEMFAEHKELNPLIPGKTFCRGHFCSKCPIVSACNKNYINQGVMTAEEIEEAKEILPELFL